MNFEELNDLIPYAMGGKEKILSMSPYPNITLKMPGRHAKQTLPKGGDFVVCVDSVWFPTEHQFTHNDIFDDIETKRSSEFIDDFMSHYRDIVCGDDPDKIERLPTYKSMPGIEFRTFLYAVQCLAVAEHRRYAQHENKFGGRYLPLRFSAGIGEGLWNAEEASWLERKGRPGVEQLERERGIPILTQGLFDGI